MGSEMCIRDRRSDCLAAATACLSAERLPSCWCRLSAAARSLSHEVSAAARSLLLMQSQCSGSLAVTFVRLALTSCLCRASAAARCHMKSVRQLARCRRARAATSSIPTASASVDVQSMRQQPAPFPPRRLPPLRSDCCLAAADAKSVQRLARCRIRSPRTAAAASVVERLLPSCC